jgi:carbonic anhydrase
METFTDDVMRDLLRKSLRTAEFKGGKWVDPGKAEGRSDGDFIDWLTIRNQEESVIADVRHIRMHTLVPQDIPIYGYIYDVRSGKMTEVAKATEVGRPMVEKAA